MRRTQRLRLLLGVLGLVVVAGGWMLLYTSQAFEIRDVEVTGTDVLTPTSVEASAAVPAGATLLRLPADEIERRVLGNPWIASVELKRDFPATLKIVVSERVPFALVDTGDAFWSVDADGRMLGRTTLETTASPLVVIRDVQGVEPVAGRVSDATELRNAIAVMRGIAPEIAATVRGISAPTVNETVLITEGSIEIMVGEATQLEEKSALISGILEEQAGSVVFIDVRSIERPISRGLGE